MEGRLKEYFITNQIENQKFLVVDKSGWEPFSLSISQRLISTFEIRKFLGRTRIIPSITQEAILAGEFTKQSYFPNLFSGQTFTNIKDKWNPELLKEKSWSLSITDGTLVPASLTPNGIPVGIWIKENICLRDGFIIQTYTLRFDNESYVIISNNSSYSQTISDQGNLWESSKYWKKLGEVDKSVISVQRVLKETFPFTKVASLTNDINLRKQHEIEGLRCYGSGSMLAGMVLRNVITYKKANSLYNKWAKINTRWVPKTSFKYVFNIEKERFNKKESFWL